jgi:hypothetical protein
MALLSKPSSAARTALIYITSGALILVWTGIWLWWLRRHPPADEVTFFWAYGFLLSGATLLIIGFFLGRIGRAARHAELPPPEITRAAEIAEQNASARAPLIAPVNPVVPTAEPIGQVPPATPVSAVPPVAQPVSVARR